MQIYSVFSDEFRAYGQVMPEYDFSEMLEIMATFPMPEEGADYVASEPKLEACAEFKEIQNRAWGGIPIQMGYAIGENDGLYGLEYHRNGEMIVPDVDVVLLIGKQEDIIDGKYDTKNIKAFHVPAKTGVELYATTLHNCPCIYNKGDKFRILCALPRGTNQGFPEFTKKGTLEEQMLSATNNWYMAHPDVAEEGQYVGLVGENIKYIPE